MEPYWITTCTVLVPGLLLASWIDFAQRRVPNWLNAALALLGLCAQGYFQGWPGVTTGLAGIAVGLAVLIIPWLMHGMGAGDVKMMAAIGAWVGPWMTAVCFMVGAIVGGIMAAAMIVSQRKVHYAWGNLGVIVAKCSNRDTLFSEFGSARSFGDTSALLPYGIPLTIGTLIVLTGKLMNWWMV